MKRDLFIGRALNAMVNSGLRNMFPITCIIVFTNENRNSFPSNIEMYITVTSHKGHRASNQCQIQLFVL